MNRRNFFKAAAAGSAAACLPPVEPQRRVYDIRKILGASRIKDLPGPTAPPGHPGPAGPVGPPAWVLEAERQYAYLGHTVGSPQFEQDVNATLLGTILCRP